MRLVHLILLLLLLLLLIHLQPLTGNFDMPALHLHSFTAGMNTQFSAHHCIHSGNFFCTSIISLTSQFQRTAMSLSGVCFVFGAWSLDNGRRVSLWRTMYVFSFGLQGYMNQERFLEPSGSRASSNMHLWRSRPACPRQDAKQRGAPSTVLSQRMASEHAVETIGCGVGRPPCRGCL